MKFFATLLLTAAAGTAMAAEDQCATVGERCNLSIHPPVRCCPFMTCAGVTRPGEWGWVSFVLQLL